MRSSVESGLGGRSMTAGSQDSGLDQLVEGAVELFFGGFVVGQALAWCLVWLMALELRGEPILVQSCFSRSLRGHVSLPALS